MTLEEFRKKAEVDTLIALTKADSPDLVTDMRRTKSYL